MERKAAAELHPNRHRGGRNADLASLTSCAKILQPMGEEGGSYENRSFRSARQ